MAFITTTIPGRSLSLGDALIRLREAIKQIPLGEERFTGSTHARDVRRANNAMERLKASGYRPTYALKVV